MASGAGKLTTSARRTPPPPSHSPVHPIHDHGRHTPPIAEENLKNIDLENGGSGSEHEHGGHSLSHAAVVPTHTYSATRRRDHASAFSSSASAPPHEQPYPPRQSRGHGRGHAASSVWTLVWAQIKRFDIELSIGFLITIFICSAIAVSAQDEGWFLATAPLENFPLVNTLASFSLGLSSYVTEAHGGDEQLTLYRHEGPISELSFRAGDITVFLHICLVDSLLLSVGLLWYVAQFYQYLKSSEVVPSRDLTVRLLGLKALMLGLLLLGLGTGAFRAVIWDDLKQHHSDGSSSSSSNGSSSGGPTSFTDIDSSELFLETRYAYALTIAVWFLWLIVGTTFLFRSCCRAKSARLATMREEEREGMEEGEMEGGERVFMEEMQAAEA
eukprot:evm.model.NODE_33100_length_7234_cov_40.057369.2